MNTDLTEAAVNKSGRPKNSQIMRQSDCPNVITVLGPRNTPLRAWGTVADLFVVTSEWGVPPNGIFYPWARWDWGLADFRRCSRDGACVFCYFSDPGPARAWAQARPRSAATCRELFWASGSPTANAPRDEISRSGEPLTPICYAKRARKVPKRRILTRIIVVSSKQE